MLLDMLEEDLKLISVVEECGEIVSTTLDEIQMDFKYMFEDQEDQ